IGESYSNPLFSLRSQHQIQPDVSAQDSLGTRTSRKHVHLGNGVSLEGMKEKKRVPTDGQTPLRNNPFEVLKDLNLPAVPAGEPITAEKQVAAPVRKQNRGRVDILRQTAHRGGKTVTVVTNFVGVGQAEQQQLGKAMQKACGAGGTVKDGRIEIQGDHRDTVVRI